jgi:hypothetical protein
MKETEHINKQINKEGTNERTSNENQKQIPKRQ